MRMRSARSIRILVVDDEVNIAVTLAVILAREGYEVATAFSGEQAVLKAPNFDPHLLITDLRMGVMDGVEAATRIISKLPDCRVLFFSGAGSLEELSHAAPKGLVYSLAPKPIPIPDLLSAIAYLVPPTSTVAEPAPSICSPPSPEATSGLWPAAQLIPFLGPQPLPDLSSASPEAAD